VEETEGKKGKLTEGKWKCKGDQAKGGGARSSGYGIEVRSQREGQEDVKWKTEKGCEGKTT
jgi:hypothetical protein